MRKTRFMSLLFLVLSIAFFFVPDFRQALQGPFIQLSLAHSNDWLERAGSIPTATLVEALKSGEERRDGRSLAFVAMHTPSGGEEAMRVAAESVAIDPGLTWIYAKVIINLAPAERGDLKIRPAFKLLEAWDPDNAFPYLLEGGQMVDDRRGAFPPVYKLDELSKETEWRSVMDKAFAAPRYDSYKQREFDLDRTWLGEHHLAKPATMIFIVAAYPIPSLMNLRLYSELLTKKLGKDAEAAGHLPEAEAAYWAAAHLGERMQSSGSSLIEKLIGIAIQKSAYEQLLPLLRRSSQADQAASLEYSLQQNKDFLDALRGKDLLVQNVNYNWTALLMGIYVAWVAGLSVLTALAVSYVNVKRFVRHEEKGGLYNFVTVAENYLPVLLFFACLGLYLTYYPYAQNFHQYMTRAGQTHDLEPLFHNILPSLGLLPEEAALPIGNPLIPYAWYATAGVVLVVLSGIPAWLRAGKLKAKTKASR